jgi:hypothetical protein
LSAISNVIQPEIFFQQVTIDMHSGESAICGGHNHKVNRLVRAVPRSEDTRAASQLTPLANRQHALLVKGAVSAIRELDELVSFLPATRVEEECVAAHGLASLKGHSV